MLENFLLSNFSKIYLIILQTGKTFKEMSVDDVCGSICIIKHIDTIRFGKSYSYHLLTSTSKVLMMQPSLLLLHAGTSLRLAKLLSVVVKSLKQTLAILPKAAAILIRSLLWSSRFTGLKIELCNKTITIQFEKLGVLH